MFVGRLDEVKGVSSLINAFKNLLHTHSDIHLILAGDGDYNRLLTETSECCTKITFTGKLCKKKVQELYQLADIGVIPSIHEEFGLVAIEMMMHKLPIVVGDAGGLYVDFDYESIKPLDEVLKKRTCCFASEPIEHLTIFKRDLYINNALMASAPEQPFMNEIIQKVFMPEMKDEKYADKMEEVLNTTGPIMLSNLLEQSNYKDEVFILPASHVSPFSKMDARQFLSGTYDENFEEYLENKLEEAFAIHYFIGAWT